MTLNMENPLGEKGERHPQCLIVVLHLPMINMKILHFEEMLHMMIYITSDPKDTVIPMEIRMTVLANNHEKPMMSEKIGSLPPHISRSLSFA